MTATTVHAKWPERVKPYGARTIHAAMVVQVVGRPRPRLSLACRYEIIDLGWHREHGRVLPPETVPTCAACLRMLAKH